MSDVPGSGIGFPSGGEESVEVTRRGLLSGVAVGVGTLAGCQSPTGTSTTADPTSTATQGTPIPRELGRYSRVYLDTRDAVAVVETDSGQGSCFGYDSEGRFVTNHHVVDDATQIDLHFSRDDWRAARVLAADVFSDLAVLEVETPPSYAGDLEVEDGTPTIGQEVLVLGTPFGLQGSLTTGIVSGVNRALNTPTGYPIPGAVQTDAAVNPGNSGGPMLSLGGQVIGVVTAGGGENIGFGIPPRLVRRVIPALIEDGSYDHPFLGVALLEVGPTIAAANDLEDPVGVIVVQVLDDTPSDGVFEGSETVVRDGEEVPVGGDIIVALDDRPVSSLSDLSTYLAFETSPGDRLDATILRDGARETVEVTVGRRPRP